MINFATLQGLTIPEGVVTQITDASGRLLWAVQSGEPIVLEVEKITSNTYVSSTSYTNEQFLMLAIYPKTASSIVNVTYGGLTKTLTFTSTDAQEVYFGTYGGVADSVTTPASGTLTIKGDCIGVGVSSYNTSKNSTTRCSCITAITEWGGMTEIPNYAFSGCTALTSVTIPDGVTTIGESAFSKCTSLSSVTVPASVTTIGDSAFATMGGGIDIYICDIARWCAINFGGAVVCYVDNTASYVTNNIYVDNQLITQLTIPDRVTAIPDYAFSDFSGLKSVIIHDGVTSIGRSAFARCYELTSVIISDGVMSIGDYAFDACYALTHVTIPASVTSIGCDAFNLSNGYSRTVTMLSATPPTLYGTANTGTSVFHPLGTQTIVVPAGSGTAYRAAEYWSEYADYITEAS